MDCEWNIYSNWRLWKKSSRRTVDCLDQKRHLQSFSFERHWHHFITLCSGLDLDFNWTGQIRGKIGSIILGTSQGFPSKITTCRPRPHWNKRQSNAISFFPVLISKTATFFIHNSLFIIMLTLIELIIIVVWICYVPFVCTKTKLTK